MKTIGLYLILFTFISCNSTTEPNRQELKLISWNCDNFQLSLDTLHKAATFINSQDPDILCLQERPHTNLVSYDSIKKAFPTLLYKATNGREDENLNIAIFSKYPLQNIKTWYFTKTYNKMIQADVCRDNDTIRLYNVHLQTTGHGKDLIYNCRQRYKQSDLLKKEIQNSSYPVIICGDFNDIPISYTVMNLLSVVDDQSQCLKGSYQKLGSLFKIDYVLSSPSIQKRSYNLISNPWSDHKMQISHVR
ncbi:MAG: endonuclease/exonuclease/phosphatase family protein [Bacteroidales bacterium]|nr:endonuclease/exonuclease/phosphatase family protein [Bacteroidales bacterium]